MTGEQALFASLLVGVIVLQAVLPSLRLMVVLGGAALTCVACVALGVATVGQLFADVPWDVLVILVALGLYADQLASSRLFGLASVGVTRAAGASPVALLVFFTFGTYLVSGVVNNITALLVVLPVLLSVFALIGVTPRYTAWTLGLLLVACNLGGAATPIGDFPAVLLLGRGTLSFRQYLAGAALPTFVALAALTAVVVFAVRPARDVNSKPAPHPRDARSALPRGAARPGRVDPRGGGHGGDALGVAARAGLVGADPGAGVLGGRGR